MIQVSGFVVLNKNAIGKSLFLKLSSRGQNFIDMSVKLC